MRNLLNGSWTALIAVAAACLAVPGTAVAQDSDQGTSTATIVQNLTLTKVDDLAFGSVVAGDAGGTVSINAGTGAVTQVGDVRILASVRNRGRFAATAPLGILYVMNGDPTVTLNRVGGGGSMVATLQYRAGSGIAPLPLAPATLMVIAPNQDINVGGTLAVSPAQPAGDYEGTFNLTLLYL